MTSTIKVDTIQTAAGAVPTVGDLGFASGSVVKVTRIQTTSETSNSTQNYVTVWEPSYTPVLSNSKIIFAWTLKWICTHGSGAEKRYFYRVNIGGSEVFLNQYTGLYTYTGDGNWNKTDNASSIEYTNTNGSAITLQFQGKNVDSNSILVFNEDAGDMGVLTVIETVS